VLILVRIFNPFVSSIKPDKIEYMYLVSKFNNSKIGYNSLENSSNKPELFKTEIITENSTTNPPIITTVLIALVMLLESVSPKFENVTLFDLLLEDVLTVANSLSLNFQNLNNSPTIIQARKCVVNSRIPN